MAMQLRRKQGHQKIHPGKKYRNEILEGFISPVQHSYKGRTFSYFNYYVKSKLFFFFEIQSVIFPLVVLSGFQFVSVAVDVDVEILIKFNDGFEMSLLLLNRLIVNWKIF